ncbi:MAG: hypothetical protein ACK4F8_08095 [Aquabacterium sp.]
MLGRKCGQCKCRLTQGEVANDPYDPQALNKEERD